MQGIHIGLVPEEAALCHAMAAVHGVIEQVTPENSVGQAAMDEWLERIVAALTAAMDEVGIPYNPNWREIWKKAAG